KIKDALGRQWQLSTVQFDFNLPERFNMTFVDRDGIEKQPFMIHRALLGSLERFFGVLLEHYAGAFPAWLAPEQVRVIPVAESFGDYAEKVVKLFKDQGFRVSGDFSTDRLNAKIRNAQKEKIPFMLILGEKEMEADAVSVRYRSGKQENGIPIDVFADLLKKQVENREN
ncbi:MAG: threonine--tRNA ligase, partial [Spirochaetes bacterium]|nr:threonine--tRNA ligase [Spirochaetota bacterium]